MKMKAQAQMKVISPCGQVTCLPLVADAVDSNSVYLFLCQGPHLRATASRLLVCSFINRDVREDLFHCNQLARGVALASLSIEF